MTPSQTARVLAWLTRDTFRRSLDNRVFWIMMLLSVVAIAACLSVTVEGASTLFRPGENADFLPRTDPEARTANLKRDGVDLPSGELKLAFGAFRIPLARDARDAVRLIEFVLAAGLADTAGLLLGLVWTAGFLPGFLEPRAASVLLAKPVPRSLLFLGQFVGVLAFVAVQAMILIGGTWLALGVRTGIWEANYLLCIPILLLQFAIFFSVSALIAAHLRGTAACVLGAVFFWLLCWGMNYGRHAVVALPKLAPQEAATSKSLDLAVEAGYWVLPKPADLGMILSDALGRHEQDEIMPEFAAVRSLRRFHPIGAVVTSILTASLILGFAVHRFDTADY